MDRRWDMLRAAIPFVDSRLADTLEVVAQMGEVQDLLAGRKERTELSVCGGESNSVNIEGLLQAIREFCNERERRIVDMILNFFQMRQMMEMVQMMQAAQQASQAASASSESSGGGGNMDIMMEMLKSNMPEEQKENFDMMEMVLSMMKS